MPTNTVQAISCSDKIEKELTDDGRRNEYARIVITRHDDTTFKSGKAPDTLPILDSYEPKSPFIADFCIPVDETTVNVDFATLMENSGGVIKEFWGDSDLYAEAVGCSGISWPNFIDGDKKVKVSNFDVISKIRNNYPETYIQVGGGIRDIENINSYLDIGIDRVIVGTRVVSDPSFLEKIPSDIKEKVIIDLAVKDGKLAVHGWNNSSDYTLKNFIKILESNNIREIVFTDVSKDGMLEGMNFPEILNILSFSNIPLIASGGVTSIDDIKHIYKMNEIKISGVIIGKALYENKINLEEAIKLSYEN